MAACALLLAGCKASSEKDGIAGGVIIPVGNIAFPDGVVSGVERVAGELYTEAEGYVTLSQVGYTTGSMTVTLSGEIDPKFLTDNVRAHFGLPDDVSVSDEEVRFNRLSIALHTRNGRLPGALSLDDSESGGAVVNSIDWYYFDRDIQIVGDFYGAAGTVTYNIRALRGWNMIKTTKNRDTAAGIAYVATASIPAGYRWRYLP